MLLTRHWQATRSVVAGFQGGVEHGNFRNVHAISASRAVLKPVAGKGRFVGTGRQHRKPVASVRAGGCRLGPFGGPMDEPDGGAGTALPAGSLTVPSSAPVAADWPSSGAAGPTARASAANQCRSKTTTFVCNIFSFS